MCGQFSKLIELQANHVLRWITGEGAMLVSGGYRAERKNLYIIIFKYVLQLVVTFNCFI